MDDGGKRIFSIQLSRTCNMECPHCISHSSPKIKTQVAPENEIELLHQVISDSKFDEIQFSGGEPTLFIDSINTVINSLSITRIENRPKIGFKPLCSTLVRR